MVHLPVSRLVRSVPGDVAHLQFALDAGDVRAARAQPAGVEPGGVLRSGAVGADDAVCQLRARRRGRVQRRRPPLHGIRARLAGRAVRRVVGAARRALDVDRTHRGRSPRSVNRRRASCSRSRSSRRACARRCGTARGRPRSRAIRSFSRGSSRMPARTAMAPAGYRLCSARRSTRSVSRRGTRSSTAPFSIHISSRRSPRKARRSASGCRSAPTATISPAARNGSSSGSGSASSPGASVALRL